MNTALLIVNLVVLGAAVLLLVLGYLRTRNAGYILLILGWSVWPMIGWGLWRFVAIPKIDALATDEHVGLWPFSLVSSGTLSIGELATHFGQVSSMIEGALVLAGIWLVVLGHVNLTKPSNTPMQTDRATPDR
jgi:hypothetical protein